MAKLEKAEKEQKTPSDIYVDFKKINSDLWEILELLTEAKKKGLMKMEKNKVKCYSMDEKAYMQGRRKAESPESIFLINKKDLQFWERLYDSTYNAVVRHRISKKFFLATNWKRGKHDRTDAYESIEMCQGYSSFYFPSGKYSD